MIDISFSIVTYNSAQIIGRTISSFIDLIDPELSYKLYVIDNNSKDKTVDILKRFGDKIEVIILDRNVGFGSGHNSILNRIESKYHVIVNPDIIIENQIISEMYYYMENNKDVGMLTPSVRYLDGRVQYLCKKEPNR